MQTESGELQPKSSQPSSTETAQIERDLNDVIPILAHGLVRRIEQKGFSGKIRVSAMAGDDWGVAKSPDNLTDIPNRIVYPRAYLSGDIRLINARLRHEIGNLNYPIEGELNALRHWCKEHQIAPELLTSLVEATHEASVDYLEMQNSHSSQPEENFRALYEQDINTQHIANNIHGSAPYKQALDIVLLYTLSQTQLVPHAQFEQAFSAADPVVQEIFTIQTLSVLGQLIKIAVPQKKVEIVRDYLWPKFSHLAAMSNASTTSADQQGPEQHRQLPQNEELSPLQSQVQEMKEELQKMLAQMPKQRSQNKRSERPQSQQKETTPAEKREQEEDKDTLKESLVERLQDLKEQFEKLEQSREQTPAPKPESLEDVTEQAEQLQDQMKAALQQAQQQGSKQETIEQLEDLKEQLEQLIEVAKQVTETELPQEEEKELLPDEELTYSNIHEHGIDETQLTPEQIELLNKVRDFAKSTTKIYRTTMRLLMAGYRRHNPQFTEKIVQEMMERRYDLPDFSLYGSQAAGEFLSQQPELGINSFDGGDFLINFNLPRPIGRFWYKGGAGKHAQEVNEGEIEWGHFYRASMPVIWNAVDRALMSNLILDRLNEFGQHNHKQYYYLWEAKNFPQMEDSAEQSHGQAESEESEQGGKENGPDASSSSTAKQMQDLLKQLQESLEQAKSQGGAGAEGQSTEGSEETQQTMEQLSNQLSEMQEALQKGANPQDMAGQFEEVMQKMSGLMEGLSEGEGQGNSNGQAREESGQPPSSSPSGEPGDQQHDQFQQGGQTNERQTENLFSKPDPELLKQLREMETLVGSKFSTQNKSGDVLPKDISRSVREALQPQASWVDQAQTRQLDTLEELKRQQQLKMESIYREMSGLDGEALRVYVEYMESTKDFAQDLTDFFIRKFKLDKEYIYERNQRRGARLQRGYTQNILGIKDGSTVLSPRSFERKRPPEKPQFAWTLIIDNSGSCGGEIIEQEKKLAVALVEVAKGLDIPLEIVTFGGANQFIFLKGFEQDIAGEDLQKMVLLNADQGTPDVVTLEAACSSMEKFTTRFNRSYNFVYFMTDGQSGEGSIQEVIKKHKKDMIMTGVGMAGAAQTISQTWGKNAVEVPDVKKLSDAFIKKIEEQIDYTFD